MGSPAVATSQEHSLTLFHILSALPLPLGKYLLLCLGWVSVSGTFGKKTLDSTSSKSPRIGSSNCIECLTFTCRSVPQGHLRVHDHLSSLSREYWVTQSQADSTLWWDFQEGLVTDSDLKLIEKSVSCVYGPMFKWIDTFMWSSTYACLHKWKSSHVFMLTHARHVCLFSDMFMLTHSCAALTHICASTLAYVG